MLRISIIAWIPIVAAGLLHAQPASVGQKIHRCSGPHGEIVFSGMPCAAAGATPADARATRIEAAGSPICPASREALRERIASAIGRRDPNALAALLRWDGIGARSASGYLRMLRALAERPLLAIDENPAAGTQFDTDAASARTSPASDDLRVRTGGGDSSGVREQTFGVDMRDGCYWLLW